MRKWYEWVRNYVSQRADGPDNKTDFIGANWFSETQCIRDWIEKNEWKSNEYVIFDGVNYSKKVLQAFRSDELTEELVTEWVDDPEYQKLIREVGLGINITTPLHLKTTFSDSIQPYVNINRAAVDLRITMQPPGYMFPLHYDRPKFMDFNLGQDHDSSIQRWLIMLYDQQPGQCFFMNDQSISWKAGDSITWDHTMYPHGSANFGYYTRYSLMLTAYTLN